jgi:dUTP pyrophosphatase
MKVNIAKVREGATIPSKRVEDGGYDLYPCFDEDYIIILPHKTKLIPTGLATAFDSKYVMVLRERGSTGAKGMALRSGVVDSGYRGEIFVGITNTNDFPIVILKNIEDKTWEKLHYIIYPYEKAIAQAFFIQPPIPEFKEISYDELQKISSERGIGKLGSSNK